MRNFVEQWWRGFHAFWGLTRFLWISVLGRVERSTVAVYGAGEVMKVPLTR